MPLDANQHPLNRLQMAAINARLWKRSRPQPQQRIALGQLHQDPPAWLAWLEALTTPRFSYALHNRAKGYINGFMTVRKERRQRGGVYWSVYHCRDQRLRKIYVSPSSALTHGRLETFAIRMRDPPSIQAQTT